MASNIYEDPNSTTSVSCSDGVQKDGAEKAERVVDIYESADTSTRDYLFARDGGACSPKRPPAVQRNPFKAASLILALLCVLLVAAVTVLSKLYELNMTHETDHVNSLCPFQTNSTVSWSRFGCSCYYRSTELRNWSESRADCVNRGADLVIINSKKEQDFVCELNQHGESWIGLQSVLTDDWKWEWKSVDGSTAIHFWSTIAITVAVNGSKAYIDRGGKMSQTNNGLLGWICEKQINL